MSAAAVWTSRGLDVTIKQGSPSAAGSPGKEGLGALGTPGAGATRALQSPRGTKTGHAGQAGRGVHTSGPEGAWRDGLESLGWEKWDGRLVGRIWGVWTPEQESEGLEGPWVMGGWSS